MPSGLSAGVEASCRDMSGMHAHVAVYVNRQMGIMAEWSKCMDCEYEHVVAPVSQCEVIKNVVVCALSGALLRGNRGTTAWQILVHSPGFMLIHVWDYIYI